MCQHVARVLRRTDGEYAGRWGLWFDARHRWASVVYMTERDAKEALRHLQSAEEIRLNRDTLEKQT